MVAEAALLVVGIGLSILAGYLLQKKNRIPFDDRPTQLSNRGAYVPRLIGRRQIGFIHGWAGSRRTTREKVPGASSNWLSGPPKQTVYIEDGWHLLCVGPAFALHAIYQGGEPIFFGPITRDSHPSGTLVNLGKEGSFRVFWGEQDQPVNTYLGDSSRVGISSRWPSCCYIEWRGKRLGPSAVWPQITYVLEADVSDDTHLSQTPAVRDAQFEATPTLGGRNIHTAHPGGNGVGKFRVPGSFGHIFKPSFKMRLTDNTGIADQDFFLLDVEVLKDGGDWFTDLYPVGGVPSGAENNGLLRVYKRIALRAINHAHAVADVLFSPRPYGLALDKARWDMDSLEAVGTRMVTEGLRGSFYSPNGESVQQFLGQVMQDLGLLLPVDPLTGLLQFVPIREPSGTLPHIPYDAQTALVELEIQQGPRVTDRISFLFNDENNGYRDMPISRSNAGQMESLQFDNADEDRIYTTTNYATATHIANRRELERLAPGQAITIRANRGARRLKPGQAITVEGIEDVLRVVSVKVEQHGEDVELTCTVDYYGARLSDFLPDPPERPTTDPIEPDPAFDIWEIPEFLLPAEQAVVIPRIRAHDDVHGAYLYISRDDSTYEVQGLDETVMQGGTLDEELPTDTLYVLEEGPVITALGEDIDQVLDLSADETSWRNGRQLVVIGTEVFFLREVTPLGGDSYRLDGLIRARYDTRRQTHAAGTPVFILQNDDSFAIRDVLLEPQVELFAKSQPVGLAGVINIAEVAPVARELYGKGVRPIPVSGVRLTLDTGVTATAYLSGADLVVQWAYSTPRSPGTGAGMFAYGVPQLNPEPEGDFLVEILDATDTVVRADSVSVAQYAYTAAMRTADFGGEPASLFKVRVTQTRGGLLSDAVTQTITKAG